MHQRLEMLIEHVMQSPHAWSEMEVVTGISRSRWRSACREVGQRVSEDMIEAAVKNWPEYVIWLVTGKRSLDCSQGVPGDIPGRLLSAAGEKSLGDDLRMSQRLLKIIQHVARLDRPWSDMDATTGISRQRWRAVCGDRHKVTQDMIEAVAHHWPQYVCWLVAGQIDLGVSQMTPGRCQRFAEQDRPPDSQPIDESKRA